jgi:hypothetical protein
MSKHRTWIVAGLLVPLLLAVRPARADFCLKLTVDANNFYFFHFSGGYPRTPNKLTPLKGMVEVEQSGNPGGMGPAFGQILGLPVGDAGNALGITFMYNSAVSAVANASVVLDDDFMTSGGGAVGVTAVGVTPGGAQWVGGQIVDCSSAPFPPF